MNKKQIEEKVLEIKGELMRTYDKPDRQAFLQKELKKYLVLLFSIGQPLNRMIKTNETASKSKKKSSK